MNKEKIKTNYKSWAFRLLIYFIIFNLVIAYYLINYGHLIFDSEIFNRKIILFSIISYLILITGIVLTLLSIKNKEQKDYKYYTSIIGFSIMVFGHLSSLFL